LLYNFSVRCNGEADCTDASDELGCSCSEDEFTCDCITQRTCTKAEGCIVISKAINGFLHCPGQRIFFGDYGRINFHKLNNISECNDIGFPQCDNSTCFNSNISTCDENQCSSDQVICTSHCDGNEKCSGVFQCNDNRLILLSQFCDGIVDCFDGSDEIQNQPGFKCSRCVLPQTNLYDDFAQCDDSSDLCLDDNENCFTCIDRRLIISSDQLCDGVSDCYDMSDECLCEEYFDSEMCVSSFDRRNFQCFDNENLLPWQHSLNITNITSSFKSPFIECQTKFNTSIYAIVCDGRPECKNYKDECECENPPFPMGDRYCDGVEDPAWKFINDSACPQGFDELLCPNRFRCSASGKISIDVLQVCDGKADCDDNSDEKDCPVVFSIESIFSSETEMISNPLIKALFWIMGFAVIAGNAYVIIFSAMLLKKKKKIDRTNFYNVIILNIAISDFIMGLYLLTIASYSAVFSGIYGTVDHAWRSSINFMVVLSAFRLRSVTNAVSSLTDSMHPWIFSIVAAWILSFFLSTAPIFNRASQYFLHSFSFSNSLYDGTWLASNLEQFACRIVALFNTTIPFNDNEFQSTTMFFEQSLPDGVAIEFFGYYGETSVCMPRFYVGFGESSWEYTTFVLTLNFLSFLFIAISCIFILKHTSQHTKRAHHNQQNICNKQAADLQKRIARIIATDFCCWIPICIMAYVRLGVAFSNIAYQISAVLLLPINSAINPFLFTSLPDKLINLCRQKYYEFTGVTHTSHVSLTGISKIQSKDPKSSAD